MNDHGDRYEAAHAAYIAILAEGVAMTLFLGTFALWFGIFAGRI